MPLSSQYPYYGKLGSGPYNVSLAFFGPLSEASKSIGIESSTGLLLPNTDYIQKFAEGDLGISDSFTRNMIFKNINSPIASKDEEIFKQIAKQNNIDVSNIDKFKKGDKFVMPKDQIKVPDTMTGFKSFEKTALQSIFETQKPFMEIVGVAISSVAKAEDVIARVMPFFGNPLKVKSRKPIGNSGSGNSRPKAIGYKGALETEERLQKLNSIQTGTKNNLNNTSSNVDNSKNQNNQIKNGFDNKYWKVISTIYSTGTFEPNVDYIYTYIDLPADNNLHDIPKENVKDKDPFDDYKPKSIIFGIYNSKGEAIDPNEYLKTIGLKGNNKTEEVTPFKKADWLLRSPKWKLENGVIEWPSFSTPNYVWELNGKTKISKKSPGENFKIKRYNLGDKNIISGNLAIENDPIIQSFDNIESESHKRYYNDLINIGLNKTDLNKEEIIKINKDINQQLDIKPQIELSYLYGHSKSSTYKDINNKLAFPSAMRKSYKPHQIFIKEAAKDVDLNRISNKKGEKAGMIWIDPEADYDMKIIRIDPVTNIEYSEATGATEIKASIKKFIKNKTKFLFSNNKSFSLSISKNNSDEQVFENVNNYTLENWNYENNTIKTNKFNISIWSDIAPNKFNNKNYFSWNTKSKTGFYSITKIDGIWHYSSSKNGISYLGNDKTAIYSENGIIKKWYYIYDTELNLAPFGVERSIIINYEKDTIDFKDKNIPIWGLKIDDSNSKIIDPNQITNNFLTTADLFIKEDWYGHGTPSDPQTLGIIKRYALTDLDSESYYIVEGVLKKNNEFKTDENGVRLDNGHGLAGGSGWYKLPDAIGASSVFIRLLIDISVKLLPKISKLMNLFQNPSAFSTDIIAEKMGKNFEFLTPEAISTIQKAGQLKSEIKGEFIDIEDVNKKIDSIRIKANEKTSKILQESSNKSELEVIEAKKLVNKIQIKAEEDVKNLQKVVDRKKESANKLKEHYKNSILSNYVYLDEDNLNGIFILDGSATIPLSVFGNNLNFGMAMNMSDVPKKPPLKLIFNDTKEIFKNIQYLINNENTNVKNTSKSIETIKKEELINLKKPVENQLSKLDKQPPFKNKTIDPNNDVNKVEIKFEDGSVRYIPKDSLQTFVLTNQNKYNFIYVTEELNKVIVDVNDLLENGTQQDLDKAKEKLNDIKKKFPNDSVIDDKIKEVSDKNSSLGKNIQPLLKSILGITTFPIKIVADIIKWLFDFFKSLTNPMTLASKMKEFLSFEWILKFFKPTSILDIFGIKFDPLILASYASKVEGEIDMSKYISLNMIPPLPSYNTEQYEDFLKGSQPTRFLIIFKMIQKFINSVIDFIWSLFGIEAIIKAPHISIVKDETPENIKEVLDKVEPKGASSSINNLITNNNSIDSLNPIVQEFIYEVKLPDGTTKSFLNNDELVLFIEQNNDINYDFTF